MIHLKKFNESKKMSDFWSSDEYSKLLERYSKVDTINEYLLDLKEMDNKKSLVSIHMISDDDKILNEHTYKGQKWNIEYTIRLSHTLCNLPDITTLISSVSDVSQTDRFEPSGGVSIDEIDKLSKSISVYTESVKRALSKLRSSDLIISRDKFKITRYINRLEIRSFITVKGDEVDNDYIERALSIWRSTSSKLIDVEYELSQKFKKLGMNVEIINNSDIIESDDQLIVGVVTPDGDIMPVYYMGSDGEFHFSKDDFSDAVKACKF